MKKSVLIIAIIISCLLAVIIYIIGSCLSQRPHKYSKEEVEQMFDENRQLFAEVAEIIFSSELIAIDENKIEPRFEIFIHDINKIERYYTPDECDIIRNFFKQFKPYEIQRRMNDTMSFFFDSKSRNESISIRYFETDQDFSRLTQNNTETIDKGDGWYICVRSR